MNQNENEPKPNPQNPPKIHEMFTPEDAAMLRIMAEGIAEEQAQNEGVQYWNKIFQLVERMRQEDAAEIEEPEKPVKKTPEEARYWNAVDRNLRRLRPGKRRKN